jgi:hypothetical protein
VDKNHVEAMETVEVAGMMMTMMMTLQMTMQEPQAEEEGTEDRHTF